MTENQPPNNDPTNDQPTAPQPAAASADSGTAPAPAAAPTSSTSSRRALAIGAGITAGALVLALGGLAAGAAMASGQDQDRDRDRDGSGPPWQDGEWRGPMGGMMGDRPGGMMGRGPGGERGPGSGLGVGLAHGLMVAGPALHGEAVIERDGEYVTITMQRGEATAVSATSITVLSDDGFTRTYAIDGDTVVRSPDAESADAAIDGIESGDDVHVMALADGDSLTARAVMEPGSWHGPWWAGQDDKN